jgi:hypothetical protein
MTWPPSSKALGRGSHVAGLDFSAEMVALAQVRFEQLRTRAELL